MTRQRKAAFRKKARGFTLVELLVVITIIGMLASLLLPAINSAREMGRKAVCMNNIANSATALISYESNKKSFPGYANIVNGKRASWVVVLLPFMERNDLYNLWTNLPPSPLPQGAVSGGDGTLNGQNPWPFALMNVMICPSSAASTANGNPLSYVINTGSAATANDFFGGSMNWIEDRNSGVAFNQSRYDFDGAATPYPPTIKPSASGVKTDVDFISTRDGTSYTVILAENLQARTWVSDPTQQENVFQNDFQIRQSCGFCWFVTGGMNNIDSGTSTGQGSYSGYAMKINGQARNCPDIIPLQFNGGMTPPLGGGGGLAFCRPSSMHPGGASFCFCDKHYRFISEDISYDVYTQLMTPSHQGCMNNQGQRLGFLNVTDESKY